MESEQKPLGDEVSSQASSESDDLQFDRVETGESGESGPTGMPCTACHQPVSGYYYQVNNGVVCVPCREQLGAALTGGSGLWRLIKAMVYGTLAAAVGAGIYFAVLKLTGYEFGLIAIVVGIMVGIAVKSGSEGRGGWLYQLVAIGLTYCAIVTTYVPMVYSAMEEEAISDVQKRVATAPAEAKADMAHLATFDGDQISLTPVHKAMILIVSIIVAFVSPFLSFNPIGYIIIGVGLYEAWKLTKRVKFNVAGPFAVGSETTAHPAVVSS